MGGGGWLSHKDLQVRPESAGTIKSPNGRVAEEIVIINLKYIQLTIATGYFLDLTFLPLERFRL